MDCKSSVENEIPTIFLQNLSYKGYMSLYHKTTQHIFSPKEFRMQNVEQG